MFDIAIITAIACTTFWNNRKRLIMVTEYSSEHCNTKNTTAGTIITKLVDVDI